jgi:hypothetical protein
LGFKNLLTRVWQEAEYRLEIGAIRNQSQSGSRYGVGTPGSFVIVEPPDKTDAERYYLKTDYSRRLTEKFFWQAGLEAETNEPSGIDRRTLLIGSVGHDWFPGRQDMIFKTIYGLSYTDEEFTAGGTASYAGLRLSYLYMNKLTETTQFDSELYFDEDLEETSNWRAEWYNAVSVTMTNKLALKASLRLIFRNQPPLESIGIFDPLPPNAQVGTALVEAEDLDTVFSTALVLSF